MKQISQKHSLMKKINLFFLKIRKKSFAVEDGVLKKYIGKDKTVLIHNNVTCISEGAFSHCKDIESVEIPNNVTKIGDNAFYECSSLRSITIPDSVTSIGKSAFEECAHLKSVNIPDGIIEIKERTFYGCHNLETIVIPNSVTKIGDNAFYECSSLRSITISSNVTNIGEKTFLGCTSLKSITYKNTPEVILPLMEGKNIKICMPFSVKIFEKKGSISQQDFLKYVQLLKQSKFNYDESRIHKCIDGQFISLSEEDAIQRQLWTGKRGDVQVGVTLMVEGDFKISGDTKIGDTISGTIFKKYIDVHVFSGRDNKQ